MARALADAFVRIRPDTTGFRAEVDAKLTAAMAGLNKNILVTANTAAALTKMAELRAQMADLSRKVTSARLIADDKPLQLSLAKINSQLQALEARTTAKKVTLAGADKVETQLMALNIASDTFMARALDKRINLDSADAQKKLAFLITATSDLSRRAYEARVGLAGDAAVKMAALVTEIESLTGKVWDIRLGVNDAQIGTAAASLAALTATFEKLTYKDVPASLASTTRLWGVWGALGARVALFGGLATVSGWHIAIDSVIEALAVLVPAITVVAAGLGAFGIAGVDAAKQVMQQFQALHTVSDATGKTIAPMTGNLEKLHNAVRPQVFQLLGDAIQIAGNKTGIFNKLALGTGSVIDKIAAHITVLATSAGSGLNTFLAAGEKDAKLLGQFLMNIGNAIFNLIKVSQQTHIADFLLQGLVAASKLLDLITKLPTPLLAIVVGLHGLYLWGGLAATGLLRLIAPLVRITSAAGGIHATESAVKGLADSATPLERLKAAFSDISTGAQNIPGRIKGIGTAGAEAGTKVGLLERAGTLLSAVPIAGWAAAGVIAFAALTLALGTVRSAAVQFASTLVDAVNRASNAQVMGVLNKGLADLNARLSQAKVGAAGMSDATATMSRALERQNQATNSAASNIVAYQQAQVKLTGTQKTVRDNLSYLEKTYGVSMPQAVTLATMAGVKLSQNITGQSMAAKAARAQVAGLVQGYGAMAAKGGQLGNDMEVLKNTATDQYKAIQQLNTGWDTFTTNMTATQNNFDTVALGMKNLSSTATTASNSLGHSSLSIKGLGSAIDGLTPKDLALNQAFTAQIGNLNTLFDSFRTAGLQNDLFKQGVKDAIAPMTKYAKGSQEATAQLVGLAQEAGFNGPVSLKALSKWLGNTHDATQNLKDITNQATIQEALLTSSMQDQGNFIAKTLIGDINNGILAYDGVREAAKKYGDAIAEDGRQSDAAHKARATLIQDIINSGTAANDSKNQIAAMISKVLGIPKSAAMKLVMTGTGSFTVSQLGGGRSVTSTGTVRGVGGHTGAPGAAAGMMVSGGTAGRDSVLINAMPGEVVVPAHMVKGGAVDHLRGKIPGFAGGGLVQAGDTSVLSGQYAVNKYNDFSKQFTDSMVAAMRAGIKTAQKQATAMTGGISGNVRSYAPIILAVLKMLGQPAGDLGVVLSQMTTESGGNPTIVNHSDSNAAAGTPSVGLMQVIGPTFAAYAGPFRDTGPFEYGTSVNPEANIYAGLNYAIHRYGGGWTSVLGHGHGYAGGTGGAAPGWAMVGEKGPELVNFSGGETVLPHSMSAAMGGYVHGYAKGTKTTLHDSIAQALDIIKNHPDEPQRYNQLAVRMESWTARLAQDKDLLKNAGLRGEALRNMKEQEKHDTKMAHAIQMEMLPFTTERKFVKGVQALVDTQEKGLTHAIGDAHARGMNKLAGTLTRRMTRDQNLDKQLGGWLNRLGPLYTHKQQKSDAGFVDSIISDAIADNGLPLIPYDKGGWLPTGLSMAYNGTGKPEKVGATPVIVQMQVSNSTAAFDMFMTQWLQHAVQVKGGGDVQVAFGRTS